MPTFAVLRALAGVLLLSLAGSSVTLAQTSPAPVSSSAPTTIVHITGFAFVPASVTIAAGQTVRFIEDDETAHTVTATDKSFDSGDLAQHASWDHTFATAGTYAYLCTYHPYMRGTVTVH